MREWCGCGAGISGKPKQVKRWRTEHRHGEPAPAGHAPTSGGSAIETSWPTRFIPEVQA